MRAALFSISPFRRVPSSPQFFLHFFFCSMNIPSPTRCFSRSVSITVIDPFDSRARWAMTVVGVGNEPVFGDSLKGTTSWLVSLVPRLMFFEIPGRRLGRGPSAHGAAGPGLRRGCAGGADGGRGRPRGGAAPRFGRGRTGEMGETGTGMGRKSSWWVQRRIETQGCAQ